MRYRFGDYTLDTRQYELHHLLEPIKLRPKVFYLLSYLIDHRDRVVSKQELCESVWPHQCISDATFDSCIAQARRAVGDSGRSQRVIQTQYGHGYRFAMPVEAASPPLSADEDLTVCAHLPLTAQEETGAAGDEARVDIAAPWRPLSPWPLAEHRAITVLMCMLTRVAGEGTRQEAESWHHRRQRYLTCIQEEIARYQGTLQHVLENGVRVFFGAPVAQEDHVQRAAQAALSLRQRLQAIPGGPTRMREAARMALHTGSLVMSPLGDEPHLDYTAVGDATSLADTLVSLASPGQIVMSEAMQAHVADAFEMRELRLDTHPGQAALRAFEVLRMRRQPTRFAAVAARGLTPHVGRERELALLQALFEQVKGGHGQVVCIAGKAGIGKSRSVFEFRRRLAAAGETVTWLEGQCLSFGQTMPWLPVVDQLRTYFGLLGANHVAENRAKVEAGIREFGGALDAHLPAIRHLLGLRAGDDAVSHPDPAERRRQLFDALVALALESAQRQPLILVYEDLHWIDASTEAFLHALTDAAAGAPLMLICTYRAGYAPPFGDYSRSFLTTLALQNLSAAHTLAMARHLLGVAQAPEAFAALLLEKTGGVPLFVEEIIKTLRAMGLRWDGDDDGPLKALAAVGVPDSIQAIIAARLDRLSVAGKQTLQLASVMGRQFSARLLVRLVDAPAPLEDALAELRGREIIEQQELAIYRFTHAIVQDVAYHSLLRQQRRQFHRDVGEALEAFDAEGRAAQAAALAHHFWEGEDWPKARDYSALAGDQALAAYANAEARTHYARAVQAAQRAPEIAPQAAARLHANYGKALMILAAYEEAAEAYGRARALMQQAGDQRGERDILLDLSTVYTNTHAFGAAAAREAIEQALMIARELPDPAGLADCLAHRVRVLTRGFGQLDEAIPDAREALQLARHAGSARRLAEALVALGRLLQWRGDFERSLALLHEGAALAEQDHAGFLFGQAAFFLGNAYTATGLYADALGWYEQLSDYAAKAGDQYWIARVPNTVGGLYLELFDVDEALQRTLAGDPLAQQGASWSEVQGHALVKAGLAELLRQEPGQAEARFRQAAALLESDIWMRWRWRIPLRRGWGELALFQGQYDAAWDHAQESLTLAIETSSHKHITRARHLQGQILAAQGRLAEAVPVLEASIGIAEALRTPREIWLGKAALGKVLAGLGRDAAAETAYGQAVAIIEATASTLPTPRMRDVFLRAAPVLEVYAALGRRPALAAPEAAQTARRFDVRAVTETRDAS